MELFILTLFGLILFFWFLKKESQKNDAYHLEQLRVSPNTSQQILNDFYRDTQHTLDKVKKELENIKKSQMQILAEHANIMAIIQGQAGMEIPKPFFTTSKKKKFPFKVVKIKTKLKENEDKKNGKNKKDD